MADELLDNLKAALGDAYRIERELAGGGMSRVFVAREQALGREVVIKVLPPELAAGINRDRFRREVQLAAHLSHPYIVPLLHAGEAGELLWFTMPYIAGESLKTRLAEHGPLPVGEVLGLLRGVAEALAYAHSHGVIHRDIKPANILSEGKHARVTDFGVAKALGASLPLAGPAGHTTSGMAIGTPAYMAPEQLAADPAADHRVDIYALGLLAYELLSGSSPFSAPSPTATMAAQLTRVPDPLTSVRQDIPPAFSSLVGRCLAKSPDNRPADANEVLAELDRISGAIAADIHRGTSGEAARFVKASPWPLLLSAAAVMLLIVGGLWWSRQGVGLAPNGLAADTVYLPSPTGDSSEAVALPSPDRPMTRADSLAIAAALRDELEQLDPPGGEVRTEVAIFDRRVAGSLSLERELSLVDSLVRSRLAENSIRVEGLRDAARRLEATASTGEASTAASEARRKVMVVSATGRRANEAHKAMAEAVVSELNARLTRTRNWELVERPAEWPTGARDLPADVLVTVGVVSAPSDGGETDAATDPVVVRISVRNAAPGSAFGYYVMSSDPFPFADGQPAYRGTVRDAVAMLENLRRVESGGDWRFDMGRLDQVPRVRLGRDTTDGPRPVRPALRTTPPSPDQP
jgi:serine/threonine-protein kinase